MAGFSVLVRWPLVSAGLIAALAIGLVVVPAEGSPGITERVSVTSAGEEVANTSSITTSISGDGRFVAFEFGGHLVPEDVGQEPDIHIRDRQTGVTERIGLGPGGQEGNWSSWNPIISQNGRFVIFYSYASNLVPDDTNDWPDVFFYDRTVGMTERVSLGDNGEQASDQGSSPAGVTNDGRYVLFTSYASNLVAGDANAVGDVFLRDRVAGSTERLSVGGNGDEGNAASRAGSITPDGRFVAFASDASNLVAGDMNGTGDAFVLDRQMSSLDRISVARPLGGGDLSIAGVTISDDGRFVGLAAEDPGILRYAFLYDRQLETMTRLGLGAGGVEPDGSSGEPLISGDGSVVVFGSDATNIVPEAAAGCVRYVGCNAVYAYNRHSGTTQAVSVTPEGRLGNGGSGPASVNQNGKFVAFESSSSDLIANDTNLTNDAFVRELGVPVQASSSPSTIASPTATPGQLPESGGPVNGRSAWPEIVIGAVSVFAAAWFAARALRALRHPRDY